MKLTTMTQVTMDGVMQGNGEATEEERRSGFVRGGWARGEGDQETDALINQTYDRADAFLLGRRTTSCTHARGDPSRNRMSPGLL